VPQGYVVRTLLVLFVYYFILLCFKIIDFWECEAV